MTPLPADEIAWARECFLAGDSFSEIAAAAGRDVAEISAVLGSGRCLSDTAREVLSLYAAGCTFEEIDRERGKLNPNCPGKAAASLVTHLRRKGLPIPHRAHPGRRSRVELEGS